MSQDRRHGEWWQGLRTVEGRPAAPVGAAFEGRFVRPQQDLTHNRHFGLAELINTAIALR
jgi:hypothetical protein